MILVWMQETVRPNYDIAPGHLTPPPPPPHGSHTHQPSTLLVPQPSTLVLVFPSPAMTPTHWNSMYRKDIRHHHHRTKLCLLHQVKQREVCMDLSIRTCTQDSMKNLIDRRQCQEVVALHFLMRNMDNSYTLRAKFGVVFINPA